jgi:hypothetical protein
MIMQHSRCGYQGDGLFRRLRADTPFFAPIARELDIAQDLIVRVEQERIRRQALMAKAKVSDWRDLDDLFDKLRAGSFPLLLLIVGEAADFRKTPAMETWTSCLTARRPARRKATGCVEIARLNSVSHRR